ncbi:HxHSH motif-containing lipoprotein [Mycoplasma phocoeninasale]|uniref:HxHSH motif-containing lipoprotein n=1 Tax=Mycoplasma phocoeninasale TaxID=2726117 RepID=UPI0019672BFA|nr:hypothetical protein [Mycoplasma phocoeninasale]MBN0970761.1 hypothetical protein [Mycoplasma phocoeninasale]
MKKKLLLGILPLLSSLPIIAVSCSSHINEDKEPKLHFDNDEDIESNEKQEIEIKSPLPQQILKLYNEDATELFNKTKENYRNYRIKYLPLKRNVEILRNKLISLAREQSIKENSEAITKFYEKWLNNDLKTLRDNPFGIFLFKYTLIFQDVDAVLADTNLVFESKEFIKHLEVIDKRTLGFDINLGEVQRSINATWSFLKSHIYDPSRITKAENLENINIDSDKNSHNHSHAIINLTYEMGLWHEELMKHNAKQLKDFKSEFDKILPNIVDNVNHIEYENNFNKIYEILSGDNSWNNKFNLLKKSFQDDGRTLLLKIKDLLEKIAKKDNLLNDISLPL